MRLNVDLRELKPAAVRRMAEMLVPGGEPVSRELALFLHDLWWEIDHVVAAGGEGVVRLELRGLADDDLHRLGVRLFAVCAALDSVRDAPFLEFIGKLRCHIDTALVLRAVV